MNISLTNKPIKSDDKEISDGLSGYNRQFSDGSFEPLSVYSRTDDKKIVGGLIAASFGNWLHISEFWVAEAFRKKSIGSKILTAAENEAVRR